MTPEQQLVDGVLRNWKFNTDRFEAFVRDLTDEQLEARVAPGRNRLLYLLGHIAAVHDRMLPLLGIGARQHQNLDAFFLESPDGGTASPVPVARLKEILLEVDGTLSSALNAWTPTDWLAKHTSVSDEDFAREPHRNRMSIVLSRNTHLAFHYGQVILTGPRS
jgi:hypothetical protein